MAGVNWAPAPASSVIATYGWAVSPLTSSGAPFGQIGAKVAVGEGTAVGVTDGLGVVVAVAVAFA